jgi:hypothetical protein
VLDEENIDLTGRWGSGYAGRRTGHAESASSSSCGTAARALSG